MCFVIVIVEHLRTRHRSHLALYVCMSVTLWNALTCLIVECNNMSNRGVGSEGGISSYTAYTDFPHLLNFIADHCELEPFSCLHSTLYYYYVIAHIMCDHMTTFQVRDWL